MPNRNRSCLSGKIRAPKSVAGDPISRYLDTEPIASTFTTCPPGNLLSLTYYMTWS